MDGLVAIGGCDKNMPGCMMAIRLDRPAVFVGGSILPGIHRKKPVDIVSVYEAVGRHARGDIDDKELKEIESSPFLEPAPAATCIPPIPWLAQSRFLV